jgi:hypothetical protein
MQKIEARIRKLIPRFPMTNMPSDWAKQAVDGATQEATLFRLFGTEAGRTRQDAEKTRGDHARVDTRALAYYCTRL